MPFNRISCWALIFFLFCQQVVYPFAQNEYAEATPEINNTTDFPSGRNFYSVVPFLRDLDLPHPVHFLTVPFQPRSAYVVLQDGLVVCVRDVGDPELNVFLDLRDVVEAEQTEFGSPESGLLGMAFHPNYEQNGKFYLFYTTEVIHSDGETELRDELAEFSRTAEDPYRADINSRRVLISQKDESPIHNAGHLEFGPDGYLYVALGDEGNGFDFHRNGQKLDKDFFSGILRIDVDSNPDSLAPNPHPAVVGDYGIPPDNPWIGVTSYMGKRLDPNKIRTEFFAIGLRNPWRFSFDFQTGDLYCNDVGQNRREEVNKIVAGGNYGWSSMEGTIPGPFHDSVVFETYRDQFNDPWAEYTHDVGAASTGSLFYRGERFPDLNGTYLFSDYSQGWLGQVVEKSAGAGTKINWLFWNPGVASIAHNPHTDEIILINRKRNRLEKLVINPGFEAFKVPEKLSETGIFKDLKTLEPHPGIIPYELNVPFWSDRAMKWRWFALTSRDPVIQVGTDITDPWVFPSGTFWVKHFELERIPGNADSRVRVETRVLAQPNSGRAYGFTYEWDQKQTEARLTPAGGSEKNFKVFDPNTQSFKLQKWTYPSRMDCMRCHNLKSGWALGFGAAQLNREVIDANTGVSINQLKLFSDMGYFDPPLQEGSWFKVNRLARLDDETVDLDYRIRSYLDVNCAYCHQPDGAGRGMWDGRITTAFPKTGIIQGSLLDSLGNPENQLISPGDSVHSVLLKRITSDSDLRMPPLGSNELDIQAIKQMSRWIYSLQSEQSFSNWWNERGMVTAAEAEKLNPYALLEADPDEDGWTNWMEFKFNTDPLNSASFWNPALVFDDSTAPGLEFIQPAGVAVWIEKKVDDMLPEVSSCWLPVPITGNEVTFPAKPVPRFFPLDTGSDSEIFRIRVRVP